MTVSGQSQPFLVQGLGPMELGILSTFWVKLGKIHILGVSRYRKNVLRYFFHRRAIYCDTFFSLYFHRNSINFSIFAFILNFTYENQNYTHAHVSVWRPLIRVYRVLTNAPWSVPDAPKLARMHRFPKWRVRRTRTNLFRTHLWNVYSVTPGTVSGEVKASVTANIGLFSLFFSLHTEMDENQCTNGIIRVANYTTFVHRFTSISVCNEKIMKTFLII